MGKIDTIIIHCSATRAGRDVRAKDIDRMHRERGWRMIGYHYVIDLDGTVEEGRPLTMDGAHCAAKDKDGVSYNSHSIGICYVGGLTAKGQPGDTRTRGQDRALEVLIRKLIRQYPITAIMGHRDTSPDLDGSGEVEPREWVKACPCFDARAEYGHLLDEAEDGRDDAQ